MAEKLRQSPLETAAWYLSIRSFKDSTSWRSDTHSVSEALSSANPLAVLLGPTVTEKKRSICSDMCQALHRKKHHLMKAFKISGLVKQTSTFHNIFYVSLLPSFLQAFQQSYQMPT